MCRVADVVQTLGHKMASLHFLAVMPSGQPCHQRRDLDASEKRIGKSLLDHGFQRSDTRLVDEKQMPIGIKQLRKYMGCALKNINMF